MTGAVLITGAGARIGRVLAKGLADDGWAVAIHFNRSQSSAEDLACELNANGQKAIAVGANLAVPAELNSLVKRAAHALDQPLTALINNASTFDPDTAGTASRALFDHHMNVNLFAPISLTRDFAGQLKGNETGIVINMIDQRVLRPDPDFFTYALSKSSLFWATKTMAQTYAPNIRVNAIGPGPTLQSEHQSENEFSDEADATLLGRGSPPQQILGGVRYLLSAKSVTGQMIAIDGGQHLQTET